jgi:hypothetical protein
MTDIIDFSTRGTASAANNIKKVANATDNLDRSWSKYSKAMSGGGVGIMGKSIGKGNTAVSSGLGSIIQFMAIQKVMEKLFNRNKSDDILLDGINDFRTDYRNFKKSAIKGIKSTIKTIAKDIGYRKLKRKFLKNTKVLRNFKNIAVEGFANNRVIAKLGKFLTFSARPALGAAGGLAGAATLPLFLDERVNKIIGKALNSAMKKVESALESVGNATVTIRDKMAVIFRNPFYTTSKVNEKEAALVNMSKRDRYMEKERGKIIESMDELSGKKAFDDLKEFFKKKDKEYNDQFSGILDMMKMEGRL